jgi:carbon-monoxide dehydrogenase large subunit
MAGINRRRQTRPLMRREDPDLVTGRSRFLADVPLPAGCLHAWFVRSPLPHAAIRSIDTNDALAADGVVAVETGASLDLGPYRHLESLDPGQARHPLALDRVRHVGEAVAVVVADDPVVAEDAAELVDVDLEPFEPLVDPTVDPPQVVLYPDAASTHGNANTVYRIDDDGPDPVAGAARIVELTVTNQRVASAPLEADGILMEPTASGGLDIWCTSQGVHDLRDELARVLDLDPSRLRVRSPRVGGGFGGRATPPVEFAVIVEMARRLGRPVRWLQTRSENLTGMPHGRGLVSTVRLGLDNDGRIQGLDVDVTADAGATAHMAGLLLISVRRQATGLYRVPALRWRGRARLTTTTPVGAYRGAGQPEANHARERSVDVAAHRLGLDPIEFRRRNLLAADDLPREQPGGVVYDSGDPVRALDRAVELVELDRWRSEQAARRDAGDRVQLGIGVACYAQTSGRGTPSDSAKIRLTSDGRVLVACGQASHGQSHGETWRALVSERLGVAEDQIDVIDADTEVIEQGLGVGGSRASQIIGSNLAASCDEIVEAARDEAATRLEVAATDLVVTPAGYGLGAGLAVAGVPTRRVSWVELAEQSSNRCLESVRRAATDGEAHPYGAHATVVEVDPDTGAVRLLRHVAVDDCGVVLQPTFVEGQQHGGSVAGIGQALWESATFDADGNPEGGSFMTYLLPTITEVCPITTDTLGTPTRRNMLGTRGIGENGCNGATAAVHNAVMDALSPFGVEHVDLPLTPERLWRAARKPTGG